jgi:transcriptional regulator with XRE-family HTH domain
MPSARKPHVRLKLLRKLTGLTQMQLADRAGVKYSYLLQVETGKKKLSKGLAEQISRATGISGVWLFDPNVPLSDPLTRFDDEFFTKEYFLANYSETRNINIEAELNPESGPAAWIEYFSHEVTWLMRAAERKGNAAVCSYLLNTARLKALEALRLQNLTDDESESPKKLETIVFGLKKITEQLEPFDSYTSWRLLSPLARIRWAKALVDSYENQEQLLTDIKNLQRLVEITLHDSREKRHFAKRRQKAKQLKREQ